MEYLEDSFGKNVPKVVLDCKSPTPCLVFSDPECLHDLYVTKNKFFDKEPKIRNLYESLTGDSIVFS